jgi:hypothetical protein
MGDLREGKSSSAAGDAVRNHGVPFRTLTSDGRPAAVVR